MDQRTAIKKTSLTGPLGISLVIFVLVFGISFRSLIVIGEQDAATRAIKYVESSSYQFGVRRTGETLFRLICVDRNDGTCGVEIIDQNGLTIDSFPKSKISLSQYLGWSSQPLILPGYGGDYKAVISSTPSRGRLLKLIGIGISISVTIAITAFLGMFARHQTLLKVQVLLYKSELKTFYAKEEFTKLALKVAHDIKSPLGALKVLMQAATELPEEKREFFKLASKRIEDIAEDLLAQSRNVELPKPVSLTPLINEVIAEKSLESGKLSICSIRVKGSTSSRVKIVEKDFKRLLSNIMNNAIEAKSNAIDVILCEKDSVKVQIVDNGQGMKPRTLEKLFCERITTKEKGNGLGLLDSKSMLNSWGGDICIDSSYGQGTTVSIILPISN
ncbi:MAG: HAMP domain-containing histidine kinase [Bdellovibrionales bacterium]|nr:HAMP domain-containing histidine kinase [Bdellovibrionales bacterium]